MHLVDLEVSRSGSRFDEFTKLWEDNKSKRWFPRVYTGNAPAGPQHDYRKWYRTVMDVDPVPECCASCRYPSCGSTATLRSTDSVL